MSVQVANFYGNVQHYVTLFPHDSVACAFIQSVYSMICRVINFTIYGQCLWSS